MNLLSLFSSSRECGAQIRKQRARLLRVAYAWCHDAALAEDLVHDTLARAMARCHQVRDPEQIEPWLFGILTNAWRDHLRRQRPLEDIESLEEALPDPADSPEQERMRGQIVERVRAAVASLPLGQREVLTLIDLEDFSYAEVARILGIPVGTVMSRLCRARQALRQRLIDLGAAPAGLAVAERTLRRVK